MLATQQQIHIHRFHELIAFSTEDMPDTMYLTADMARKFAETLRQFASDIDSVKFADSPLGSVIVNE